MDFSVANLEWTTTQENREHYWRELSAIPQQKHKQAMVELGIKNKESVYNLSSDKRKNQFLSGVKLEILSPNYLPKYIEENKEKYKNWLAK